jgi:hypothetical protein
MKIRMDNSRICHSLENEDGKTDPSSLFTLVFGSPASGSQRRSITIYVYGKRVSFEGSVADEPPEIPIGPCTGGGVLAEEKLRMSIGFRVDAKDC